MFARSARFFANAASTPFRNKAAEAVIDTIATGINFGAEQAYRRYKDKQTLNKSFALPNLILPRFKK